MKKITIWHNPCFRHLAAGLSAVVVVLGAVSLASAASPPYSQNFNGIAVGGLVPDFTPTSIGASSSTWGVVDDGTGNHVYQNVLTGTRAFNTIDFSPTLGGPATTANSFEISTVMHGVSLSAGGTVNYTAGIAFLSASTQSSGPSDLYVADLNLGLNGGRIRLVEWTGTSAGVWPSATQTSQPLVPNFDLSKSYLLDLKGTYDGLGNLTALFTVSDVANPADFASYTFTDGPAAGNTSTVPRTGTYFGFYDSMGSGGGTMTVNFDNFALSLVPEPSALALLAVGAVMVAGWRSRRLR